MNENSQGEHPLDESMVSRFFHNVKFKAMFSKTYIVPWVGQYKWEKTPTTPQNLAVARNALLQLATWYNQAGGMDVKKFNAVQRADSGIIGAFFKGFFTNVFQRIKGNPGKVADIVKFNQTMKSYVKNLSDSMENFLSELDEQNERAKAGKGDAPIISTEADATPDPEKKPEGGEKKEGEISDEMKAAIQAFKGAMDLLVAKMKESGVKDEVKVQEFISLYETTLNMGKDGKFEQGIANAFKNKDAVLTKAAANVKAAMSKGEEAWKNFAILVMDKCGPDGGIDKMISAISKADAKGGKGKKGGADDSAANAFPEILAAIATANDKISKVIQWEKGSPFVLRNVYVAENSLYKVLVFLNAFVTNFNAGKVYKMDGSQLEKVDAKTIMDFLNTPAGKALQAVSNSVDSINKTFQSNSAFGSLQESEQQELAEGLQKIYEKDFNMRQQKMKRTNEALAKLKACMEMEEPVNETAPQDLAPEEQPITTEDNKEEANVMADKLRKLADARKVREERVKKGKMKVIFGNEGKESANEALSRLSRFAEETEVKVEQPETQVVKEPNAEPKKEHLGIEVVFGEEVPSDRALKQLQNLAYDGEPPAVEVPVDEGAAPVQPQQKPEDEEQDEVIQPIAVVTEAPGDPNDPNAADPNAADPNAAAPAPAVPMSTADLGTPPVDPSDPTAGGTVDPDAGADPAAAGADPAAAGAAPADPAAGDADAGADPAAAGGEATPAPDETQQNVAGDAPNAAGTENGEQNKYDIGATKPYNAEGEELHLTDQEQEQLFTKINLLTKIPDLVNYGKYFYNITPENVSLDDIHYINDLYELSVKLGLLTDDFEGNNLLEKYDSYKYSVLSKQPEQDLINADAQQQSAGGVPGQQVAEGVRKVKTEGGAEVEIHDAPGMVIAKDVKDYMDKKDEANAEAHGEITFKGTIDRVRGLGSLVTFTGVMFGYPVIKTLYVKRVGEKLAKKEAEEQLKKQGYADVEILAIENIDPIDYLYHEYAGMRTLEDEFTREYMKQRLEKRVARNLKKLNESVESKSIIPQEFDDDIGKIVDNLNKEIMEDPTIDFSKEVGLPKMMVTKEDFEKCYVESPVLEDADDGNDCCQFCVTKNGANNLSRVLFSTNCQKLCKCLEGIATTYGMNLSAIAEGNDILKGVDKITLTFAR